MTPRQFSFGLSHEAISSVGPDRGRIGGSVLGVLALNPL